VDGVVPAYGYWDGEVTCAPAANVVASKIHDVVAAFRSPSPASLKYVVLVGSDHVIPYQRVPDHAELMNEDLFDVPVKDPSVSLAQLARGYVPTQDYYGSFQSIRRFDHDLQVPDVAVGRLVESVEDINGYLDAYTPLSGGVVTLAPSSPGLATGYSFLTDLADFMKTNLDGAGLSTQVLKDPPTAWSADDLRTKLGLPIAGSTTPPATHFGVISLNGHFSPNEILAADYASTINASEIAGLAPTDPRFINTLILSVGCHSGYNVVLADAVSGRTQELDFAQSFAQHGATLVAPTTFGYGDTDFVGYTERLLANVALELRYGSNADSTGAVPIGGALVRAKRTYLDQIVSLSGADEKALSSLTVFGLPMLSYNLPTGPGNRLVRPGSTPPLTLVAGPAGLSTADVTPPYSLHLNTKTLTTVNPNGTTGPTVTESYYDANGDVLAIPFRPVLPRVTQSLASATANAQPRGAVLLSATYFDTAGFQPLVDVPATEIPGLHPAFVTGVFSPQPQFTLNTVNAPPKLMLVPFQYRSTGTGPTGTGRVYAVRSGPPANPVLTPSMNLRVYYSTSTDAALTLAGPPAILSTTMTTTDGASPSSLVHVEVTVAGSTTNALADLFVTFTAENTAPASSFYGQWASCSLVTGTVTGAAAGTCANTSFEDLSNGSTQSFVRRYKADLTTGGGLPGALRLMVQAVGASGAAALDNAAGAYFRVTPAVAVPKTVTKLALANAASTVAYGSVVHASAKLTDAADVPLGLLPVTLQLGSATALAVTDSAGNVSADLVVGDNPRTAPYNLTAAFAEDDTHLGATAPAVPTTVVRASTQLQVTGHLQYGDRGFIGTLRAGSALLNEQRIVIDVAAVPGNPAHTFTRNTDGFGRIFVDTVRDNVPTAALTLTYAGNARYIGAAATDTPVFDPAKGGVAAGGSVPAPNNQKATFAFGIKYLSPPTVTAANTSGGTLVAGTYRLGYSYALGSNNETAIGAAAAVTLAGSNRAIAVARITGVPQGINALRFYFTAAPAGKPTGFVIQRPVQSGAVAAFTILAGPTVSAPAATAPTGLLGLRVTDNATRAVKATFVAAGGFDWLVITGSPPSHAVFEGTGTYVDATGSSKRHYRVTVDKPANTFEIRIDDPAHPATPIVFGGTVTPLPLDDDPGRSGIVFR
ncbi:MAG: large repetitive protein, partial [Chloroflexota bacterium]|nr:large repetitive protein [Chloroflexota bacterium]